ncbi:spore cortex biosynthesis protein YabQ [Mesobacillus zeae]|uniref:Spore cortex biosynthesis protein YabQ n=1 Tax=Mesobacillus zeae TaxID=1917180 RepID=A0A398BGA7_9BACI|nr:spore cortex biosynthesis protein YabQ [Mesobacillus zeae]RID88654.1 spore cortex biosynthesis protein YabQ [Mesobacillus zeae]
MTLSAQFLTMLAMIGMGTSFGASLDTYNRFLKRRKRSAWIVFINDILFWIAQGLFIFYVLFSINQGELRFYIFIALFCGFAAYQALFKRAYLKCLEMIISLFIAIYRILTRLLYALIIKPLRLLVLALVSVFILTGRFFLAVLKFFQSVVLWGFRIIWKPLQGFLRIIWNLLPKGIKIIVEKLYNKLAGIREKLKNLVKQTIIKIKKYKK